MAEYIDREKVESVLYGITAYKNTIPLDSAIFNIRKVPTADVQEVRRGKWEVVDEAEPRRYGCSRCKCLSFTEDNYCSYCGARMERRDNAKIQHHHPGT